MSDILPFRKVLANAKLNIRLKVIRRRPDGYHEIDSIMVPVGLFDSLEFKRTRLSKISLSCRGFSVPADKENLVYRAAVAFLLKTGHKQGLSIDLTKGIPIAAGLGGGSSDAAFTLSTLNKMYGFPLSFADLEEIEIGNDSALGRERGERGWKANIFFTYFLTNDNDSPVAVNFLLTCLVICPPSSIEFREDILTTIICLRNHVS